MENDNLITDFYEFTMTQANHRNGKNNDINVFDVFYRRNPDDSGYAIACGLEEVIKYIKNLRFTEEHISYLRSLNRFTDDYLEELRNIRFTGDISAVPEGTVVFPNEPLITVKARGIEAKLIETRLLQIVNFGSLIATKASRIVKAAGGRSVLEFGGRRAQESAASVLGAKYAMIGGCAGTSNTLAGFLYGVPVSGTTAHSYICEFDSEYEAFLNYARTFPNDCVLLVDTYDTLKSGLINAIRVAKEYLIPNGYRLKGIRLDSGDLAYLSKCARAILDENGLTDCKIVASNGLNEESIENLIKNGAKIDSFGVGDNLITSASCPVFGGVYKLVEVSGQPKIKISEDTFKITNPGHKRIVRFYNENKIAIGDVIVLKDELIPNGEYIMFDEKEPWRRKTVKNYTQRNLQVPIFIQGELVYTVPSVQEVCRYSQGELASFDDDYKKLANPHKYHVDLSNKLYDLKYGMIKCESEKVRKLELVI